MTEHRLEDLDQILRRFLDALENTASELNRLRLMKEYELGARDENDGGDLFVDDAPLPGACA